MGITYLDQVSDLIVQEAEPKVRHGVQLNRRLGIRVFIKTEPEVQQSIRLNTRKVTLMDKKLLEILVCPACKGTLVYNDKTQELICRFERLAYPIREQIPIMLVDEARKLTEEEMPK